MKKHFLITFCILSIAILTQSQIRVACIGNSITYGAGIEHRDSLSYPAQMQRILGNKWEVRNFGVSGSTLLRKGNKPYWKQSALTDALNFNPDVVIIKLGTNDSKPYNWIYKNEYEANYLSLIDTLLALPSQPRILLCLPVPAYAERWGIRDSIIRVDVIPMIKKIAKQKHLKTIDLYKALSKHADLFPDKIHPNYAGAEIIARTVSKSIKRKWLFFL